ncbi:NADP-specific glutamate dehydrogenase [Rubritalea marina]|uniref:NADP-specific glutamate dehydrogenase n=1 Tax=Rubritalea marina TaxID=361055 RepID=UPI000360C243|nr:NADP-specific glutamate dehydrogenase [Rubritalea marina]
MTKDDFCDIDIFMTGLKRRNPAEPNFHQAVHEVIESVMPIIRDSQAYRDASILERITEPDRIIMFRVTWMDDQGNVRANRAWRVQFNNSIGPYKGGLRFHKSVDLDTLKFLGFEQTFKNSLTGLPMGGAKGGSNFNPKGKSDAEIMRFCHAMMTELQRHIGEDTDVPAGDIGVGARELGFLFGQYKRLNNRFAGVLTGKGLSFGGSAGRKEATGHGAVYFLKEMLAHRGDGFDGKTAIVSGSGNVALYAIDKLLELGAKVVTASDSSGFIHDPDGITADKLEWLTQLKEVKRGRISEYAEHFHCEFHAGQRPWMIPADLALPCATQNELNHKDALTMINNGIQAVAEGANMPSTTEAVIAFHKAGVLFGPAKAANAGGVAVSGLEQSQNALRIAWTHQQVDEKLQEIMKDIHQKCVQHSELNNGVVDYVKGANVSGFIKVADAMVAYGAI